MASFDYTTELPVTPARLFDFLANVHNMPRVMPPTPRFEVIKAPPRLFLGARFQARVGMLGLRWPVTMEITWFAEGVSFTDTQVTGPLRKWQHTHRLEATGAGCRMTDHVEFEPPGGWLGWILTENAMRRALKTTFQYRDERFREALA